VKVLEPGYRCTDEADLVQPWPLISQFLESLPSGTIGLDSGAGNGKYVPTASGSSFGTDEATKPKRERMCIALDRSEGLLEIARTQLHEKAECLRGDLGFGGWRAGIFVSPMIILHAA
jgi:tRNA (uracil-5-)-methyltransferase TRM9